MSISVSLSLVVHKISYSVTSQFCKVPGKLIADTLTTSSINISFLITAPPV